MTSRDGSDATETCIEGRIDVDSLLDRAGFDPDKSVLTRRQAEVLALRECGLRQVDVADRLGTTRANVSGVEASARENVEKARETVALAEALAAPIRVEIESGVSLYEVPERVYEAADDADIKVDQSAPDLMKSLSEAAGDGIEARKVKEQLLIGITSEGEVWVRVRE